MTIKKIARLGGIFYLIIIVTGIFGQTFVRERLIVFDDATATVNNILASEQLWRISIAGDLLMHICDIPLMVVFYLLLKPVNKYLALTAVLFHLTCAAVLVATKLNLITSLFLIGDAAYLKTLAPEQLYALATVFIRSDAYGFGFGLLFFGFVLLLVGYLVIRSGYIPKLLGILLIIAGFCYIVNSFALVLSPSLANQLFPAIMIPPFIGEFSFCLWLLFKGVKESQWKQANIKQAKNQPVEDFNRFAMTI